MLSQLQEPKLKSVWPRSQGEMAARIREHDWSATSLGPPETWPVHLCTTVDVMLGCGFPATLQWGPDSILFYNDAYISLIGPRHPAALGKPLFETFPEIVESHRPLLNRVRGGEVITLCDQLFRYQRDLDLIDCWFDLSFSPVHSPEGSIDGVLTIGLETTSRVLAERERSLSEVALRRSEQRLKRVLETEAVGILFFNMEGAVVDANEVFLRMTGYTREDIASGQLNWRRMTPPEHVPASEAQMVLFARTGRIGPYEKEYILKDGTRRWMLFAGRELGDGTIAEYCIDVTDRRRAEAALNQSERYFRALVRATSDVIFRMNADWTELSALRHSGFVTDTDKPDLDWLNHYIYPDDQTRVLDAIKAAVGSKSSLELEHRIIRSDGSCGWAFTRAIPLLDRSGNTTEWFGATSDITPRKRAEAGLREHEKLAVVGRLASSIAHEINNPLEAVTNLIYLAQHDAPPAICDYLEQAQLELARVSHIATETLRFNRRTTSASETNVSKLIDSVLTLHEGRIRSAQISVHRRYSDHHLVLLFADELRQVIANLIGNAIDAMIDQPRRNLAVRVRQAHDPRRGSRGVRLTIADTGVGMTPATLRRLYEPFFTTKDATGTGLGLWVTQEIVRKHGGSIRVRSRKHSARSGTVFSVFIPAQGDELLPSVG